MSVADFSKRQLKTVRFPFEEHWSKRHRSDCSHLLQHTCQTTLCLLLPPVIAL